MSLLERARSRLSGLQDRAEAAELREEAAGAGCGPVTDQRIGDRVTVHGQLRTVTLRPRSGMCALEAELYDGSGSVTLVWLGRRRITGIDAGRSLTAHGRLGRRDGTTVIYNPRYELSR
ncbi:hypothetical protein CLV56_3144 [Mumia flava]|uniref:OB domain-containing protein n=1 Tax=Mumia flava TaxID=1348852 RepID=A0A0B2BJZ5_9ACTN|nr:OB-fold nucleic acid binding domain-containing protein [Mumia flava]PJJ53653.1 hypothetical protein CLV56_3144 [Mumia flava]